MHTLESKIMLDLLMHGVSTGNRISQRQGCYDNEAVLKGMGLLVSQGLLETVPTETEYADPMLVPHRLTNIKPIPEPEF